MAERPDEPALSPTEEERVRALLAAARHDEPIPTEVASRLDATLAGLSPEDVDGGVDGVTPEVSAEEPTVVTSLAARRRRRRRVSQLLVAAAAVTVVGVAGPQLLGAGDDMLSAGSSQDSGAESATGNDTGGSSSGVDQENLGGADSAESGEGAASAPQAQKAQRPLRLTALDFERQVADLATDSSSRSTQEYSLLGGAALGACRGDATWGPGRRVPATYDDRAGVLILRGVQDGERRVDLYLCGEVERERSTTVSVP
jgi:hypothetical protein